MANVFSRVGSLHPSRSVFDLSHEKLFDCDMGQLIPVMAQEVMPGDTFSISENIVCRAKPMIVPPLQSLKLRTSFFFVPNRIMFDNWEDFITGGQDGNDNTALPVHVPVNSQLNGSDVRVGDGSYSIWDYLGLPLASRETIAGKYSSVNGHSLGTELDGYSCCQPVAVTVEDAPVAFPWRAYNMIYNEFFRDENLIEEVDLDSPDVQYVAWKKDYFTSALLSQQRGTMPALPLSGTLPVSFDYNPDGSSQESGYGLDTIKLWLDNNVDSWLGIVSQGDSLAFANYTPGSDVPRRPGIEGRVSLADGTTASIADFRVAFQVQKFMERNMRSGVRYTEFLRAHFGVSPTDARLDRPEFIGGTSSPMIISEVLQTSSTDSTSPQGNLAGHGLTADSSFVGKYHVQEFGWIVGVFWISPSAAYMQGIEKQFTRRTRFDFPFPEFMHLSETAIFQRELYASTDPKENARIFGYQGIFNELRCAKSTICGDLRDKLDYWHLGRKFGTAPALNKDFIEINGIHKSMKRIFAVQDEPGWIVHLGHNIRAVRPLPVEATPGLIDHF